MMRYQSVTPDCLPLSNGTKPILKIYKEEGRNSRSPDQSVTKSRQDHDFPRFSSSSPETTNSGGDLLLQWGHNKRSRGSRAENRTGTDDRIRRAVKIQRRSISGKDGDKNVAAAASKAAAAMPPPGVGYTRGANLRPCVNRNVEERSNGQCRSEKRSPSLPSQRTTGTNGSSSAQPDTANPSSAPSSEQETMAGATTTPTEKINPSALGWPRIYLSLSRKEKEEDYYAMKGTKLPQRPKKRAKNVDKTLQYCFPGLWLSDLTRGRYEVREKKCAKKKRRGLKTMEVDTDSD